jgi:hypothetical protein
LLNGTNAVAESLKLKVLSMAGAPPQASDISIVLWPVGETSSTSRSQMQKWSMSTSVAATPVTVPAGPETGIVDGYGVAGGIVPASATAIVFGFEKVTVSARAVAAESTQIAAARTTVPASTNRPCLTPSIGVEPINRSAVWMRWARNLSIRRSILLNVWLDFQKGLSGMAKDAPTNNSPKWDFLTNHSHVLVCISHDPGIRLRDIADSVGITERAAHRIVTELAGSGYITREREGRRNRYTVNQHLPLPHPLVGDRKVGELLKVLKPKSAKPAK